MVATTLPTFESLLHPVTPDEFFAEYWQRKSLLIPAYRADRFAQLLPLIEIDKLLTSHNLAYPRIRMAKGGGSTIESRAYTSSSGHFDLLRGMELFRDGGTLILNHLHLDVPALTSFCQAISDELSTELQCNVYVTPPASQGFPIHYDTHDVFIAQTNGRKIWKIYDSPVGLPLTGQPHDTSGTQPGALSMSVELSEGDVLYIPRGFYHEAQTSAAMSVHLTLGLMSKSWSELLLEAVSYASLELVALREAPLPGFGTMAGLQEQDRAHLLEKLELLQDLLRHTPLSDVLRKDILYSRRRPKAGHFLDMLAINKLGLHTVVVLRDDDRPVMLQLDGRVSLGNSDAKVDFPVFATDTLARLLNHKPVKIGELPDTLDDAAKLLVVRKLIEAGLVTVVG